MKSMKYLVSAMLLGATLAGCSSNSSSSAGGAAQPSTSGKSADSSSQQTVNVAADTTFPPFETQTNGKVTGFDIDLINAIAKKENLKVNMKTMNFTGLIPALQASQVDIAVAGITIKTSREKVVSFSNAYYKSGLSILVKKSDSSVKELKDLAGKTVATKKATSSVDILNKVGGVKVQQFDNIDDAYNQLENGGAQAVVFDNPVNLNFMKSHPEVKTVGGLLTGEYYGIAVRKDAPDILKKVNDGFKKMQDSGEYAALYKQYFGDDKNGLVTTTIDPATVALHDK
ncbi:basic amino acid ABC transporter substrate-binding protein [Aneurinibacillus sp. Ricciae_BoGa-3]|uniref:basic amino acid ABC transporter substrate-binding protein n=1 Tax=Aneurinibacillus sp. Ricciae_BoGa-3 TaxID=3022697 RepID=UPI002341282A|nr:basic amino acid ABC transporter substrate-binding protein [Aneurinibacillus sp. Ricciae_BoGa-3]WCK53410.1 basic amino acid ABC transporter substrate-binding protein [Aneurinibacillus sp. Ricciae_BoGa-3]